MCFPTLYIEKVQNAHSKFGVHMAEVLFTTHDVAKILRVDKSTVKRWTDDGKLKCTRTIGGHRKFRSEDLYSFINENNYGQHALQRLPQMMSDEMIINSIIQKKEYNVLHSVCFSAAVKGKKQEIIALFNETLNAGLSIAELFDNIVNPTTKKLGHLQNQSKLTISEFHLAHNVLASAITQLNGTISKQPRNFKTIVCATIDDSKNEIELAALVTMFEVHGYTALNLGDHISAEAISQFLTATKPFAICLFSSFSNDVDALITELMKVADSANANGSHCMISGIKFDNSVGQKMDGVTFYRSFVEIESMQFGILKSITTQKILTDKQ